MNALYDITNRRSTHQLFFVVCLKQCVRFLKRSDDYKKTDIPARRGAGTRDSDSAEICWGPRHSAGVPALKEREPLRAVPFRRGCNNFFSCPVHLTARAPSRMDAVVNLHFASNRNKFSLVQRHPSIYSLDLLIYFLTSPKSNDSQEFQLTARIYFRTDINLLCLW